MSNSMSALCQACAGFPVKPDVGVILSCLCYILYFFSFVSCALFFPMIFIQVNQYIEVL